jgi:hypothetical protein
MIGPKKLPTRRRTEALHGEQGKDDHHRDGHDPVREDGSRDVQPFDGTKHRDGRRNHAVAIEQRGAEDAEQHQHRPRGGETIGLPAIGFVPRPLVEHERGQREDAAFTLVVGAHHDGDVLDRHHEQQRPDDERQHPSTLSCVTGMPCGPKKHSRMV